jgi:NADH-quinone oxidoreductase subunit H
LGALPLIIHVERRGAAFIQKRLGPNRVGPFGLLQPLADVAKFMFKEEVHPSHVKPFFYTLAPLAALVVALLPLACIPVFGPIDLGGKQIFPEVFRTEMGIFFAFAASALGSYGIAPIGVAIAGPMAHYFGVSTMILMTGCITLTAAALSLFVKSVRDLRN